MRGGPLACVYGCPSRDVVGRAVPGKLDVLRHRLIDQLVQRVDAAGALREPCESRTLESALALRLLERRGELPRQCADLRAYVERQASVAGGLEGVLARAVLRAGASGLPEPDLLDGVVAAAPDFTAPRKRALVDALLAMVDERLAPAWNPAAVARDGLHSWAAVQMTAVKIVLAVASGHGDQIDDEDVRLLVDTQRSPHVWEGNVLIHLSVLHALDRLPNTHALVTEGLGKVLEHQRPDGGLPFISDTDTWCTSTAGVALASAGAPAEVLHLLAGHLERAQQPGGGWSYTDVSCQTDVDDTSVAVQFLHQVDPVRYGACIRGGMRSLRSVAGADGGFPTYVAGAPSEASMTAAALDALNLDLAAHGRLVAEGLGYLADQQLDDGSFPPDWSSSRLLTVFRTLLVASRAPHGQEPHVRRLMERSMHLVLSQQNHDGGWGQQQGDPSDPISTSYGLIALCMQPDPRPAAQAAAYLTRAFAAAHGAGHARSDSIGPRPFTFTVPALAEIFTLLALGHLDHRLRTAPSPGGQILGRPPAPRRETTLDLQPGL